MRHVRPVARDHEAVGGRPIVAARQVHGHEATPCRTPFTHSYATVVFHTGGRSRVELNGEWNVREGDVLLVPAGEPHLTLEAHGLECWALSFCAPSFAAGGPASFLEPFEKVRDGASAVVQIPAARHAFLAGLLTELEAVGRAPGGDHDAVQRSLLTLILAEVDRAAGPRGARVPAGSVVHEALRFIERRCLGRLTLGDIAAAVGRTPAHVTSALTKATGRSAGKWIVSGRMAEARRLLLHSDERVDLVAERVGYADVTHFIRTFRRAHGATPAAWRATAKERDPAG